MMFDKVFWINSKKRTDRAKNMTQRLSAFGVDAERFEAILGGSEIASKHIKDDGLFTPKIKRRTMNNGEVGCFLSHRAIWKIAKEQAYDNVLILEDDAEFCDNFISSLELVNELKDWDMLYLGQRNYDNLKNAKEKNGDTAALTHHIKDNLYEATRCWLTHAYAVNKTCFDYLLENTKQLDYPIDGVLADIQKDLKVFAFYPNIVNQDSTQSSIR
jgi:GR25 family glycosyltransferase involved in LPS biosynthesis